MPVAAGVAKWVWRQAWSGVEKLMLSKVALTAAPPVRGTTQRPTLNWDPPRMFDRAEPISVQAVPSADQKVVKVSPLRTRRIHSGMPRLERVP